MLMVNITGQHYVTLINIFFLSNELKINFISLRQGCLTLRPPEVSRSDLGELQHGVFRLTLLTWFGIP